MRIEKDIKVTMRDGVTISLCVYRPDGEEHCPTLFAIHRISTSLTTCRPIRCSSGARPGRSKWYVGKGYAYVARGRPRHRPRRTASSASWTAPSSRTISELIAWIIRQPWCNGRVGGIGQSYYSMAQWLMATENPPGLACIAPYDALVDQYRCSNYHGGIFCNYRSSWYAGVRADNSHRPAGCEGRAPMRFDLVGAITEHTLNDDWWRERSAYRAARRDHHSGAVDWPLGQDGASPARQHPRLRAGEGAEEAGRHRRRRRCTRRITNTILIEFHERQLLPFYDQHLKGIDNGFMDGAPVKLYVRGTNVWREEAQWPLPRATYVSYYLRKGPSGSVTSLNDGGLDDRGA